MEKNKLNYIINSKSVYTNLYEIFIKKELKIYQYPFTITPSIEEGNIKIREKLFKAAYKSFLKIFDECFISGDILYSMKEIKEVQTVKCALYLKGRTEYIFELNNYENVRTIQQEDIQKDPLSKQIIEMIIKDILISNPKIEI